MIVAWRHVTHLMIDAQRLGAALEVVVGSAPGWKDPWARARRCRVVSDGTRWGRLLVDPTGAVLQDRDVQLARLVPKEERPDRIDDPERSAPRPSRGPHAGIRCAVSQLVQDG
jgi:hypothetical protein